jgi:hypothetical protein
MELDRCAVPVEQRALHRDFALEVLEVAHRVCVVACDDAGATAVEAGALAKGNMDVERERPRDRVLIALARAGAIFALAEIVAKGGRGRVRGVPRAGDVITREQLRVEFDRSGRDERHHGASL